MCRSLAHAVFLLGAIGVTAPWVPAGGAGASGDTANPHWTAHGCATCHEPDRAPEAIGSADADRLCLRCHDGKAARAERHPIGRPFDGVQVHRPVGWPVHEDRLSCLTCHDVRQACEDGASPTGANRLFLRDAPRIGTIEWCSNCHVPALHHRFDPHRATLAEASTAACAVCHAESMSYGDVQRTGNPRLALNEPTLCLRCHTMHLDFFEPGHTGAKASAAVQRNLAAPVRTSTAHGVPAGSMILPLSGEGVVLCSTCHNPHGDGVFAPSSPLGIGAIAASGARGESVALRLTGAALCAACHGPAGLVERREP